MEWWQIVIIVYGFSAVASMIYWVNMAELGCPLCCSAHWHDKLNYTLNIFGKILFTLLAIVIIPLDFIASVIWEILKLGIKK